MPVIRIWHIIGEYDTGHKTNTIVDFRVRTTADFGKSGKRTALRFVKESAQARMLKLKNIRTVCIEPEDIGILSWNAPKRVKRAFYRLRTIENKKFMEEAGARVRAALARISKRYKKHRKN